MHTILYVFVNLNIGGAEELLRTTLRNLNLSQFRPVVCCIGEKGAIGEEIEKAGFTIISLGRFRKTPNLRIVNDILKIIHDEKIDIVHSHLYHANMYGRLAAFRASIPAVITEHNVYAKKYKLHRRVVNWFLAKKTAKIIAVSEMVKQYVAARDWIDPNRIEVVHNGIDLDRFTSSVGRETARKALGIATDCFLIGTVGRLSEQKGHIHLIRAMRLLKNCVPGIKLLIAGSGPLEDSLKIEVEAQHLGGTVLFLGARRDIPDILNALDVFVMPSLWEGLPIALLEAMSFSLPVIVSNVGGVSEIIEDGINGLLVTPGDEASLFRTIKELYNNREFRKSLGEKAYMTVVEKFSAAAMTKKFEALYRESTY